VTEPVPSSPSAPSERSGVHKPAAPCNNTSSRPPGLSDIRSAVSGLSPKHEKAIELMLQGLGDLQIAEQIGIDRATVYRWRTKPGPFRKRLARYRKEIWKQQADRMRGMVEPALAVLEAQLANPDDPRIALRAAAILLRFAAPGRKVLDALETARTREPREQRPQREPRAAERDDALWQKIKAQIDAPLPGEASRAAGGRAGG